MISLLRRFKSHFKKALIILSLTGEVDFLCFNNFDIRSHFEFEIFTYAHHRMAHTLHLRIAEIS